MANPDYLICDKCGSQMDHCRAFIKTGRRSDAAGSMEDVGFHLDLCNSCHVMLLHYLIREHYHCERGGFDLINALESWVKSFTSADTTEV